MTPGSRLPDGVSPESVAMAIDGDVVKKERSLTEDGKSRFECNLSRDCSFNKVKGQLNRKGEWSR